MLGIFLYSNRRIIWRIGDSLHVQPCEMKNPPSKAYWKLLTAMDKLCHISLSVLFQYMEKHDQVHLHGTWDNFTK